MDDGVKITVIDRSTRFLDDAEPGIYCDDQRVVVVPERATFHVEWMEEAAPIHRDKWRGLLADIGTKDDPRTARLMRSVHIFTRNLLGTSALVAVNKLVM